jgi:hypothetical protein
MSMIRDILSCKWSNNATRIEPILNENELKTVTRYSSKSKAILPLHYFNQEKSVSNN